MANTVQTDVINFNKESLYDLILANEQLIKIIRIHTPNDIKSIKDTVSINNLLRNTINKILELK